MAEEQKYLVDVRGQLSNPMTEGELRRLLETAELSDQALVRTADLGEKGEWRPVREVVPPIVRYTIRDADGTLHGPMPQEEVAAYAKDRQLSRPLRFQRENDFVWRMAGETFPELSAELVPQKATLPQKAASRIPVALVAVGLVVLTGLAALILLAL